MKKHLKILGINSDKITDIKFILKTMYLIHPREDFSLVFKITPSLKGDAMNIPFRE